MKYDETAAFIKTLSQFDPPALISNFILHYPEILRMYPQAREKIIAIVQNWRDTDNTDDLIHLFRLLFRADYVVILLIDWIKLYEQHVSPDELMLSGKLPDSTSYQLQHSIATSLAYELSRSQNHPDYPTLFVNVLSIALQMETEIAIAMLRAILTDHKVMVPLQHSAVQTAWGKVFATGKIGNAINLCANWKSEEYYCS